MFSYDFYGLYRILGYNRTAFTFIFLKVSSLLPRKKQVPPFRFSLSISYRNKSHPAVRSIFSCLRSLNASTMLAPSGINASPLSKASAKAGSFNAVLYECALMVLISSLPSGNASSSLLCPRSEIVFNFNMYKRNDNFPQSTLRYRLSHGKVF